MLHVVQLISSYFYVIQQPLTEIEPRINEEKPTNATPSTTCDSKKDEIPPHDVQYAPESDKPQRSAFLINHQ